jgi:hypothetical protein
VLPSGAVIGETVAGRSGNSGTVQGVPGSAGGRGRADASGRAPAVRAATKPTPPSWLPEERGSSGRPSAAAGGPGRPASTAGGALGTTGAARRSAGADAGEGRRFDPDNLWGVASGVDPVIAPSRHNPRHDPGPNVIGYHG